MRRSTFLAVVVALLMPLTAFPTLGADNGTVNATVATAAPCMTLDMTSVDFGVHSFQPALADGFAGGPVVVSDCSTVNQELFVSGTNASSTSSSVVWTLTDSSDPCAAGLDTFRVSAVNALLGNQNILPTLFRSIGPVWAGSPATINLNLWMPCEGSSGQGETMTFDINFLVTIP